MYKLLFCCKFQLKASGKQEASTYMWPFQKKDSVLGQNTTHLLVKGSGDPSLNSSYFYNADSSFFNPLIQKLKTKGLKKITGSIITDVSYFNNTIPSTWIWGDIGNYFGAGANGLSYHDNKFSLFYNSPVKIKLHLCIVLRQLESSIP